MPEKRYASGFFKKGDLVAYAPMNEDGNVLKCEIGVVKSVDEGRMTAFVAYSTGDTCAHTRLENLMKVENAYAVRALADRMEQLGCPKLRSLADGYEDWSKEGQDD